MTNWYIDIARRLPHRRTAFALWGIVVAVAVMMLSLCVVVGFKRTVTDRVASFGAHIRITSFDSNATYHLAPITLNDSLNAKLSALPYVTSVAPFITVPAVLKSDSEVRGVVLRASTVDSLFASNLLVGTMPVANNDIALSETLAQLLDVKPGDRLYAYSVGEELRVRRLTVVGLYSTGFSEGDNLFVFATLPMLARLCDMDSAQSSGLEVRVDKLSHLDEVADAVWFATANRISATGEMLYSEDLRQLNPQIFAWLDLLDMNVVIILTLMLLVASFSIVSALIILVLASVPLIGTLKALGADNGSIRRIFIVQTFILVGRGMLYGNLIALGIAGLQAATHVFPLDPATYYVPYVPVAFPWTYIILLNIFTALVSLLVMLLPSAIATRISPAQTLRFD